MPDGASAAVRNIGFDLNQCFAWHMSGKSAAHRPIVCVELYAIFANSEVSMRALPY
jgi:hypothetical protein